MTRADRDSCAAGTRRRWSRRCSTSTSASWPGCCSGRWRRSCARTSGSSATQQGLITAIPLLGGSLFRPVLGMLGDRIGGRRTGLIGMVLTLVAAGRRLAVRHDAPAHFYALGFFLGIAGASFAVALPLASRWYPPRVSGPGDGHRRRRQLGHAAGDAVRAAAGRALRLGGDVRHRDAAAGGWCSCVFALMAKDSPTPRRRDVARATTAPCCASPTRCGSSFLYSLTFGGFVGFASFLTTFFHEQYQRVARRRRATSRRSSSSPAASCARSAAGCRIASAATGCWCCCWRRSRVCLGVVAAAPPLRRGRGGAVRRHGRCWAWATARCSSWCRSAFRSASAWSPASSARPAGSAASSCRRCSARCKDCTGSYTRRVWLAVAAAFVVGTLVLLELGARWSQRWAPTRSSAPACIRIAARCERDQSRRRDVGMIADAQPAAGAAVNGTSVIDWHRHGQS